MSAQWICRVSLAFYNSPLFLNAMKILLFGYCIPVPPTSPIGPVPPTGPGKPVAPGLPTMPVAPVFPVRPVAPVATINSELK
jgi:hypothetical protein